ncbi:cobalt ABC transporter permease [Oricola sp.]|uniref:cobalt ABC transporter permease n=1 Tax=Oricola sp. TaxID=1979950 RepID=UPI0025F32B75|nr:cobalt ABC transporter permease [Oricola sp.]MCI5078634.1 cobalt ABC transporter permease [Oricola sp.]
MKSRFPFFALTMLLLVTPAHAHKVIASVFASGDVIEGEIGFSNGDMAVDALVEVFDGEGNRLGETRTDEDGFFTYRPAADVKHVFKANLGAGHVAEVAMEEAEVARIMGKAAPEKKPAKAGVAAEDPAPDALAGAVTVASLTDEEREAIAEAVRDETRSLRREIAAYKEKNDFQTILGGIGYIAGLFGLGFYLAARRKVQG